MFARKSIYALTAATLLATSMPALADRDRGERYWDDRYQQSRAVEHRYRGTRQVVVERHVDRRIARYPAYEERPVYRAHPARVYHPPVHEPAPVYYPLGHESRGPNVLGTAAGAIVGAAIGSQVGYGHDRAATTAIGAVIGGVIGSQF
jgi:hypothetical protein